MHVVVIGGQTRAIGKTSVMAGLIRAVKPPGTPETSGTMGTNPGGREGGWTAVKVTPYAHGSGSHDGEPCAPGAPPFTLTEERDAAGRGDTCRFLAAGARRALWLRVGQGQLAPAWPALREALRGEEWVMMESNSIVEFLAPDLYLMVIDGARPDFKTSAQRFFDRADALVAVGSGLPELQEKTWPEVTLTGARRPPVFPVNPRDYSSPELVEFVTRKLRAIGELTIDD